MRREKGIVCALLAWREGSLRKKVFCQNWEQIREEEKNLLFIIGTFFKGIDLFLKFGNSFRKINYTEFFYRRKFIQYHNRGIHVWDFFWGDRGLYCRPWVLH